ncbi:hypothetical protein JGH11_11050 [Dysgonomonas sp. Marseille-P4677]|uniref:hypothetical protein n=1 Tax=Dysgonomonas sp. Marseille-P4677 TaxID=2364790 RepID=UPI001913267B|nr:hypothetical protein [Dysgonomonas sp. Marseille-P4677]MBK5721411.1 hypothetical protein [Dysgonomonas sp. Marseille-P4677]
MKKIFNYLLVNCVIILGLASCGNENDIQDGFPEAPNQTTEISEIHTIYKGVDYFVKSEVINDSVVFLGNEEFQSLYNNILSKNENLSMYYNEDGSLEYFDSYEELAVAKNILSVNDNTSPTLKTTGVMTKVTFWDDKNYKDRAFSFLAGLNSYESVTQFRDKPYYFNDKCSSLKLEYTSNSLGYKGVVRMYEHDNFRGKCLVFEVSYYSPKRDISNLNNHSFGDKMTSFILDVQPL